MHKTTLGRDIQLALSSILLSSICLLGCQPKADDTRKDTDGDLEFQAHPDMQSGTHDKTINEQRLTSSTVQNIDWSKIDSGVAPITPENFAYPFAIDSEPVKSYARYFHVTPAEAQYSLTVGTASNEPLPALLEQLGDYYISHELVDGKEVRLMIHTTADVAANEHMYVFSEPFARGLTMPIQIVPQN